MNKEAYKIVSEHPFRSFVSISIEDDKFKISGILETDKLDDLNSICDHLSLLAEDIRFSVDNINDKCIQYFLFGSRYISRNGQIEAILKILSCLHVHAETNLSIC